MANRTPIQWCDSTVNPAMGCDGCELWPTAAAVRQSVIEELLRLFPGTTRMSFPKIMDEEVKSDLPGTALWKRKKTILNAIISYVSPILASFPKVKKLSSLITKAYKAPFKCYAGRLHLTRGGNKGYARTFEELKTFTERTTKAANAKDLFGKQRTGKAPFNKSWLNGLPRLIFVSDMGDVLSKKRINDPDSADNYDFDYVKKEIIDVAASENGQRHIWLWLTKRPEKMAHLSEELKKVHVAWPDNLVAMTSVTTRGTTHRLDKLKTVQAKLKALSVEPLWEPVSLNLEGIAWCIVGGESGSSAKPFDLAWARSIHADCLKYRTAFFLKQLGAAPVDAGKPLELNDGHGGDWDEWPDDLNRKFREMPPAFYDWGSSRAALDSSIMVLPPIATEAPLAEQSLEQLAEQITDFAVLAEEHSKDAKQSAYLAIECAAQAGLRLLEAKERLKSHKIYGEFGTWQEEHFPNLSRATLSRYMVLAADFSRVRNLPQVTTLRQAYIAIGVIKAKPAKPPEEKKARGSSPLDSHVKAISAFWEKRIAEKPFVDWKKADQQKLKKKLSVLADIFKLLDDV